MSHIIKYEKCVNLNSNLIKVFICYFSTFVALKLFHLTFHTLFKCLKSFSKK